MSNLYEFGGSANVILKAICDFTVNDTSYTKGDVVFCFQDVNVRFTYNETIKDKTVAGRNLMAYDERKLNAMLIDSTPLTKDFIELFATKTSNDFEKPVIEELDIVDNTFYPTQIPSNNKIFIIGEGQHTFSHEFIDEAETLIECTLDGEGSITGRHECIYDVKVDKPKFDINNNYTLPYFKAQITTEGNVDKTTSSLYFEVPRVSLLTRPEYSLNNQVTAQELAFKIISDKSEGKVEIGVY